MLFLGSVLIIASERWQTTAGYSASMLGIKGVVYKPLVAIGVCKALKATYMYLLCSRMQCSVHDMQCQPLPVLMQA